MLPLSLLLGFGCGIGTHDRWTLRWSIWVGVAASIAFGVLVAVDQGGPGRLFAAALLALANHLVGWIFGAGVRGAAELLAHGLRRFARA